MKRNIVAERILQLVVFLFKFLVIFWAGYSWLKNGFWELLSGCILEIIQEEIMRRGGKYILKTKFGPDLPAVGQLPLIVAMFSFHCYH